MFALLMDAMKEFVSMHLDDWFAADVAPSCVFRRSKCVSDPLLDRLPEECRHLLLSFPGLCVGRKLTKTLIFDFAPQPISKMNAPDWSWRQANRQLSYVISKDIESFGWFVNLSQGDIYSIWNIQSDLISRSFDLTSLVIIGGNVYSRICVGVSEPWNGAILCLPHHHNNLPDVHHQLFLVAPSLKEFCKSLRWYDEDQVDWNHQ